MIGRGDSIHIGHLSDLNIPSEREHAPAVSRRYAADKPRLERWVPTTAAARRPNSRAENPLPPGAQTGPRPPDGAIL